MSLSTLKDKDWGNDWLSAATTNQKIAYPDILKKENGVRTTDITIKATDPEKIALIEMNFGITLDNGSFTIKANDIASFKILGSAADDFTSVKQVVELIN